MSKFLKFLLGLINTTWIKVRINIGLDSTRFLFSRFNSAGHHKLRFKNSVVEKSFIDIKGNNNCLDVCDALIFGASITINGSNNIITIAKGVKLRQSTIILRGNNCSITIDEGSTFGGARIINTGDGNTVSIGKNCLFSDNIEVWASDTHPIYDATNEILNKDKPIYISDRVWVGSRVIILKGVTIGEGSVVGMGSVVTKSIPPNVVSVGYPNKTIKENIQWQLEYK